MKRAIFAVCATIAAIVMLVSYRPAPKNTAHPPVLPTPVTLPEETTTSVDDATPAEETHVSSTRAQASPTTSSPTGVTTPGAPERPATTTSQATTAPAVTAAPTRSFTGNAAPTRFGPVQVSIVMRGARLTSISILQYPNNNPTDAQINARALPILQNEALKTQSAQLSVVSGATYTSEGFMESLQSALQKAGQ